MKNVLVSGSCNGNFEYLYDKIRVLQKKGKNFDCLLMTGSTLSLKFKIKDYISGDKKAPVKTYFIDASEVSQCLGHLYPDGKELFPNFFYLGRAGVKDIEGLKVAYLSGIQNEQDHNLFYSTSDPPAYSGLYYNSRDVTKLKTEFTAWQETGSASIGVDVLLTNEFPISFETHTEISTQTHKHKSPHVTDIISLVNPRYHFCSLEGVFLKRAPYRNKLNYPTRIISLTNVPGDSTERTNDNFIFAITTQSLLNMPPNELYEQQTKMTDNPFATFSGGTLEEILAKESLVNFRDVLGKDPKLYVKGFNLQSKDDEILDFLSKWGKVGRLDLVYDQDTNKHKGYGFVRYLDPKIALKALEESGKYTYHGRTIYFDLPKSTVTEVKKIKSDPNCWFCLSSAGVDKTLIFYVGEDIYIALDKGPVTKYHMLLIPIDHHASSILLPIKAREEIGFLKSKINTWFAKRHDSSLVYFERRIRMKDNIAHMHIQCVPIEKGKTKEFRDFFEKTVRKNNFDFFPLKHNEKIDEFLKMDEFYFYFEIYDSIAENSVRYLYKIPQNVNFSQNFGRQVLCDGLNLPSKSNWNNSMLSETEKGRIVKELKAEFLK